MPQKIKIKNRNTRQVYEVTEREWEQINSNPMTSGLYSPVDPLPVKEEPKSKTK